MLVQFSRQCKQRNDIYQCITSSERSSSLPAIELPLPRPIIYTADVECCCHCPNHSSLQPESTSKNYGGIGHPSEQVLYHTIPCHHEPPCDRCLLPSAPFQALESFFVQHYWRYSRRRPSCVFRIRCPREQQSPRIQLEQRSHAKVRSPSAVLRSWDELRWICRRRFKGVISA